MGSSKFKRSCALGLTLLAVVLSSITIAAKKDASGYTNSSPAGCPDCHPGSASCHYDWKKAEIDSIRESWMDSIHVTLFRDAFSPCTAFFIKGDCLRCHPNFFRSGKPIRPDFRKL
ncbi:MAG: hypothetical protein PVJ36_03085 [Nitrospirota bacterium]